MARRGALAGGTERFDKRNVRSLVFRGEAALAENELLEQNQQARVHHEVH